MIHNQLPTVWQVWLPAFLLCLALLATGAFCTWLYRKVRDWDTRMAEDHIAKWQREQERKDFGRAARGVDLWRERGAPFDEPTEHQASRREDSTEGHHLLFSYDKDAASFEIRDCLFDGRRVEPNNDAEQDCA